MLGTAHPRRIGLEDATQCPEIEAPPPASSLALVIAGGSLPAASAATPTVLAEAHADDDDLLVILALDLHVLDHDALVDTDELPP
jgi:hypothetical protein